VGKSHDFGFKKASHSSHKRATKRTTRDSGKAGDVVRIKLRNNMSINHAASPHACHAAWSAKGLSVLGLSDIEIGLCQVSEACKSRLRELIIEYQEIFSKHPLDCGEVKGYIHRIRLTDDHPFRRPYWRVPPAHYQKLRQVLTDMEVKGMIGSSWPLRSMKGEIKSHYYGPFAAWTLQHGGSGGGSGGRWSDASPTSSCRG